MILVETAALTNLYGLVLALNFALVQASQHQTLLRLSDNYVETRAT